MIVGSINLVNSNLNLIKLSQGKTGGICRLDGKSQHFKELIAELKLIKYKNTKWKLRLEQQKRRQCSNCCKTRQVSHITIVCFQRYKNESTSSSKPQIRPFANVFINRLEKQPIVQIHQVRSIWVKTSLIERQ